MEQIIQIIPAPADLLLRYKQDDGVSENRPLCLALIQHDGFNAIHIMDVDSYGIIETADSDSNFDGVEWKENNHD